MDKLDLIIDSAIQEQLQLESWKRLPDAEKRRLGESLSVSLKAHGRDVQGPMMLREHGPAGESLSILQWRDAQSLMTFSLVPGGKYQPGFDSRQLELVAALVREDGGSKYEELAVRLAEYCPALVQKDSVDVAPFFTTTALVRPQLPGLKGLAELSDEVAEGRNVADFDFMGDAVDFEWRQVAPIMKHYRWELPTSAEFEWALRGGDSSLFYWGDEFPLFMQDVYVGCKEPLRPDQQAAKDSFDAIMSAQFAEERPHSWPWCNRFGLAAMLPRRTWCESVGALDDPLPLVTRGGAANAYPWQGGCFEWISLLNASESRCHPDGASARFRLRPQATIRPVIRLVSDKSKRPR